MKKTIKRRALVDPGLSAKIHPVLRRIYGGRAITSALELDYGLNGLLAPSLLKGMDEAVALLIWAICQEKRILIVADFDADGATSCAVGVRGLTLLGAKCVNYLVPNRFKYGYGLTPEIVALAAQQHPDLIITVDNGISSLEGVRAARQLGIKVLVTDHHMPGQALPEADAIVNPNQWHDHFPSKNLAGVGVIFYVLLALRAALRQQAWFNSTSVGIGRVEPNMADLLDIVALGTVADVVPLDHNNRILVSQGLARIRQGQCAPGLLALLQVANRDYRQVVATDLAFALGPRINAAGRLEDMSIGIALLLSQDLAQALPLAQQLDHLNKERRIIEAKMKEEAFIHMDKYLQEATDQSMPQGICVFDESWHQGVIGLVASRLKDHYHRPAIAFAPGDGDILKGSARSVDGIHIRDALEQVSCLHPEILSKFGGHAMAAGLSIQRRHFDEFCAAFNRSIAQVSQEMMFSGIILSDGALATTEVNLELADLIKKSGPWGQGFPEPVFDGEFTIARSRVLQDKHLKLDLRWPDSNLHSEAMVFSFFNESAAIKPPQQGARIHAAYRLDINTFRGQNQLQLIVEYLDEGVN